MGRRNDKYFTHTHDAHGPTRETHTHRPKIYKHVLGLALKQAGEKKALLKKMRRTTKNEKPKVQTDRMDEKFGVLIFGTFKFSAIVFFHKTKIRIDLELY